MGDRLQPVLVGLARSCVRRSPRSLTESEAAKPVRTDAAYGQPLSIESRQARIATAGSRSRLGSGNGHDCDEYGGGRTLCASGRRLYVRPNRTTALLVGKHGAEPRPHRALTRPCVQQRWKDRLDGGRASPSGQHRRCVTPGCSKSARQRPRVRHRRRVRSCEAGSDGRGLRPAAEHREPPGSDCDRGESQSSNLSAETKASWGMSTEPIDFIRFLPSFCFFSSLFFRVMSPP